MAITKQKNFRFSKETRRRLTELAINDAITAKRQVTETEIVTNLIIKAYKKLKGE